MRLSGEGHLLICWDTWARRTDAPARQVILSQGNRVSRSSKLKLLVTSLGNYQHTERSVLRGSSQACGMPLSWMKPPG